MLEKNLPSLPVAAQISLLSFYYQPQGEMAIKLDRMFLFGQQFLGTPFFGVRQMIWHLQNEGQPLGTLAEWRIAVAVIDEG
jgi:putative transposase